MTTNTKARRIEFHETLDPDGVTRDQADNAILITPVAVGQCAFYVGDAVAYGEWVSESEYELLHAPTQEWFDFVAEEMDSATA